MDTAYKRLRKAAGLTQSQIANELGMATQYWQKIEAGKRTPQMPTNVRIVNILAPRLRRKPASVLAELSGLDAPKSERQPVTAA